MDVARKQKRVVYVGGIGSDATEAELQEAFVPFGPIEAISIEKQKDGDVSGGMAGHAFVQFQEMTDAVAAIDNMNENLFKGDRVLTCNLAHAASTM